MHDKNARHWLPRDDAGVGEVWHGGAVMRQQTQHVSLTDASLACE